MKTSIVLALLFSFVLCAVLPARSSDKPTRAPDFSLKGSDGKSVELKRFVGKVVVVNFWATWCGPCRAEIPGMVEVYEKYKKNGLEIVGISLDAAGWKVVTPYVQKAKITYPVVLGDEDVVKAYGGIDAIPVTFIINRKGDIIGRHVGSISREDFEKEVKNAL